MYKLLILLLISALVGCITIPPEDAVLAMSEREFRLWVRQSVATLQTVQWSIVTMETLTTAGLFILLPGIIKGAVAKGVAAAGTP